MSELDRVLEMFDGDGDVTGKTANISAAIREIKALREVVDAAKELLENHDEASGACAMCLSDGRGTHAEQLEYALVKVDEARR
jgi:hypothetical protein